MSLKEFSLKSLKGCDRGRNQNYRHSFACLSLAPVTLTDSVNIFFQEVTFPSSSLQNSIPFVMHFPQCIHPFHS